MGGRFGSDDDGLAEAHEINVTPMIDVILVLLIIYMVAAPLATVDVPVDLPSSSARPAARPERPIFLTLRADLSLVLGETAVERSGLASALAQATAGREQDPIYLRADRSVSYGDLMQVMNLLRQSGHRQVGLVGLEDGRAP